ncbi:MAG: transcriptional regulator [Ramlibacter sp.]|nr:transcriptional regulator [Ramlibacter sp.]MCE3269892.1 transcriptional regulator [Ramlibacter sp.]
MRMPPAVTTDAERLRSQADRIACALKMLANPDRMLLLWKLSQGERCVGELEAELDIHQPTLSQQLGVLRSEGAVTTRRVGKHIYYSAPDPELRQLVAFLYHAYPQDAGRIISKQKRGARRAGE